MERNTLMGRWANEPRFVATAFARAAATVIAALSAAIRNPYAPRSTPPRPRWRGGRAPHVGNRLRKARRMEWHAFSPHPANPTRKGA